ncbi:NAD-dependent epimerase/dehydratase family protein [Engelhardtia mirabilis]|uniref:3 beta-hydroxysteroid dehydrogenase/Delta 5-->4-isomerase n=1 Tax=Engelhardtia mirabilis TaxID=2528011 RepID=A0A518BK74_9BACT|nr:3 beta-hydroxysteroid dehydrogenase/Delta 5-->4-isomerase [Planctomycetes bacterium Pla133]QDV01694.1 3 beta-hydroxysteroid dehydrogenase/Delta 5-->4-isomerase [Planctomycetes bacterium Pla86]
MRIAITGATGFIGGYMVPGMLREGHQVRVLCRPGRAAALPKTDAGEYEVHEGDLTDRASLTGFLKDVDLLLHLASAHDHVPDEMMRAINIDGTENLLSEAKANAPSHFRFWVISSAVIGAPVYSYYRDTKRIQEKIIRAERFEWASFRPTLVYGVGDYRHTAPLLRRCAAKSGRYVVPHDGLSKINPVHVDDVVDAIRRFFDFERGVDCMYELAGPAGVSYNEFIDTTIKAAGGGIKRKNISKRWADWAIFIKGLFTDVTEERRASAYFSLHHEHDISNAQYELGWAPRTYAEGITQVAHASDWWREDKA